MFLLYSFISIITKSYESENQKVISKNELLKKQNKDIADNILHLAISEEKFSKAFNICPVAISIAPINDGRYIEVNEAFLKITGFEREEVIGKTFDELNFYTDNSERQRLIDELLKNGYLRNFEFQFRMKNGEIRDSLVTSDIIEIEGKKCSLNFLTDITEQKQTEKVLLESELKFRTIFENSRDAISVSKNGTFVFANTSLMNMFGYQSQEEIIGKSILEIIAPRHQQLINQNIRERAIGNEVPSLYEIRGIRRDGIEFDIEISVSTYELNEDKYTVGMIRDISGRKLAEAELQERELRLRKLFSEVEHVSIQGYAPDGTTLYWNNASERIYGYKAEEAIGKNLLELIIPPEMREDVKGAINYMAESGIPIPSSELNLMRKDGSLINVFSSHSIVQIPGYPQELYCIDVDLTERRLAEKQLQYSEKKYKELFESNTDGITIFLIELNGPPTVIIDMNENSAKMLGFTKEEMMKMNPNTLENNLTREKLGKRIYELQTQGFSNFETTLKHKDGFDVFVEIKAISVNYDNQPALMNIVRDITERKKLEKEISENEIRFRAFVEQAPMSIGLFNKDGIGLYANPKFIELLGLETLDNMIGRPAHDYFVPQYREDSKERTRRRLAGLSLPTEFESICVRADGSEFPVSLAVGSIQLSDAVVSIAFISDITERKKAEVLLEEKNFQLERQYEEYLQLNEVLRVTNVDLEFAKEKAEESELQVRALLDNAIIPVAIVGLDGTLKYANDATFKLFGMKRENFKKYDVDDIWCNIEVRNKLIDILNRSGFISNYEAEFFTYDEKYKTLLLSSRYINYNNEKSIFTVYYDISDRKLLENNLIIAKEKAEESDKLKTAFLQNMSHEIRTPLNGIIGFSNLLLSNELTKEEIKEFTDVIQYSSNRLIEIVNNVLDISKIETGQIEVQNSSVSINAILSDMSTFFTENAIAKGLSLEHHYSLSDENSNIFSDETKIIQILSNLINNAIKFTNKGTINFGYEIKDDEIEFYVSDTGVGIPDELKNRIFTRFAQVNLAITRGYEGAGLGLSICKGLVELLDGKIWFESEVDKGTTFYFKIPFISNQVKIPFRGIEIKSTPKKEKIRILIAEDDKASYQFLKTLLKSDKYELFHAENGFEAVDIMNNTPDIDLVLMDIKMPKMDGKEATKQIRQFRKELPIIAQTAFAFREEMEEFLAIGCTDYISKPIQASDLFKLIEMYI